MLLQIIVQSRKGNIVNENYYFYQMEITKLSGPMAIYVIYY